MIVQKMRSSNLCMQKQWRLRNFFPNEILLRQLIPDELVI